MIRSSETKSKRVIWLQSDDMPQWDTFVENHPFGSIYHLSGWKQVLEESFKHIKGNFIAIRDDNSNEIIAGIPLYTVRSLLTGNRLVSAPFAMFCDPLISTSEELETLLPPVFNMYKRERASYVETRTVMTSSHFQNSFFKPSKSYIHHYLQLDRSPEQLIKTFHKKSICVPISKAQQNKLKIRNGKSKADLFDFHHIYLHLRKRLELPPIPYIFFESLMKVFGHSQQLTLLLADFEGKTIGCSILLKFKKTVITEFGCDNIKFRKLYTNHFLDWEAIKLAHNEGYEFISFGRTSADNKGLIVYKSRWGTKAENISHFIFPEGVKSLIDEDQQSWKYRLVKQLAKNAPLPIFQMLGNFIYCHMG